MEQKCQNVTSIESPFTDLPHIYLAAQNPKPSLPLHSCESRRPYTHTQTELTASTMGRVRTKTVKKSLRQVIGQYYSRMTLDFHTNKKVLEEVAIIPSKRLRNKIVGFSTHLMKRIQKGSVRGISLML
ncbi:hypothetical protein SLA2020_348190 [Shorea laevis]